MAISKKKIKAINEISEVIEALKETDTNGPNKQGVFWWEEAPETWLPEERQMWDMSFMIEDRIKQKVLEILKP